MILMETQDQLEMLGLLGHMNNSELIIPLHILNSAPVLVRIQDMNPLRLFLTEVLPTSPKEEASLPMNGILVMVAPVRVLLQIILSQQESTQLN